MILYEIHVWVKYNIENDTIVQRRIFLIFVVYCLTNN